MIFGILPRPTQPPVEVVRGCRPSPVNTFKSLKAVLKCLRINSNCITTPACLHFFNFEALGLFCLLCIFVFFLFFQFFQFFHNLHISHFFLYFMHFMHFFAFFFGIFCIFCISFAFFAFFACFAFV